MTTYRFPYSRHIVNLKASPHLRFKNSPLLDVGLQKKDKLVKVVSYIDTGSQWCLFNKQYALQLGIKDCQSGEAHPMYGIAGEDTRVNAYFHDLTLIVYTEPKDLRVDNAIKIETKIGFLEKEFGFGGILGVYGFLDRFKFIGNVPEGYFELEAML